MQLATKTNNIWKSLEGIKNVFLDVFHVGVGREYITSRSRRKAAPNHSKCSVKKKKK
jgi:hypothetical protein